MRTCPSLSICEFKIWIQEKLLSHMYTCGYRCRIAYRTALDWLCWVDTSTLVGHFVSSPREREKIKDRRAEDERDREEIGQVWKWRNRRNKNIHPLSLPAKRKAGLAQLEANISWTPRWRKIPDTFATPNHPVQHSKPYSYYLTISIEEHVY